MEITKKINTGEWGYEPVEKKLYEEIIKKRDGGDIISRTHQPPPGGLWMMFGVIE